MISLKTFTSDWQNTGHVTWILASDWSIQVTWPEYWPLWRPLNISYTNFFVTKLACYDSSLVQYSLFCICHQDSIHVQVYGSNPGPLQCTLFCICQNSIQIQEPGSNPSQPPTGHMTWKLTSQSWPARTITYFHGEPETRAKSSHIPTTTTSILSPFRHNYFFQTFNYFLT